LGDLYIGRGEGKEHGCGFEEENHLLAPRLHGGGRIVKKRRDSPLGRTPGLLARREEIAGYAGKRKEKKSNSVLPVRVRVPLQILK